MANKKQSVTINDFAKDAGVSVFPYSIVSKTLWS
jgi:hypothetical protein